MTTDYAKTFLEFLKLAPRYLIAIALMAGFLLFANQEFLTRIGVFDFTKRYRAILGLALVVSVALFIVSIAADALVFARRWWRGRQFNRDIINRLNQLTEDEKQILRYYFNFNTRANSLRVDDGVVQGLVEAGIIYRSAALGNVSSGFAHNISDVAWDYLGKHPHLLNGITNAYRTDKRPYL